MNERRLPLRDDFRITATLQWLDGRDSIDAELLEISKAEARLLADRIVPLEDAFVLSLECSEPSFSLRLPARAETVKRIDPENHETDARVEGDSTGERWLVGCSFGGVFPDPVFERLRRSGTLDLRATQRSPISLPGVARWQMLQESFPVRLTDWSKGGFGLEAKESAEVGTGVEVSVESTGSELVKLYAILRRVQETDDGFTLGCQFARVDECRALERLVEGIATVEGIAAVEAGRPSSRVVTAALCALGILAAAGTIAWWVL